MKSRNGSVPVRIWLAFLAVLYAGAAVCAESVWLRAWGLLWFLAAARASEFAWRRAGR